MLTYLINGPILEVTGDGTSRPSSSLRPAIRSSRNLRCCIDIRDSEMVHSFADISERLSLIQQHTMAPVVAFVVSGVARNRLAQIYRARGEATGTCIEVFVNAPSRTSVAGGCE